MTIEFEIHDSDIFGIFIELGLGSSVSNKLIQTPGASNTIYLAENTYDKNLTRKRFGIDQNQRIVSLETCSDIIHSKYIQNIKSNNSKINSIFAASFQIGNYNENNISTHGFVGYLYNGIIKYYHISVHLPIKRSDYIESITLLCLKILLSKNNLDDLLNLFGRDGNPEDVACIDCVYNENFTQDITTSLKIVSKTVSIIYFENNKIFRIEDLLRKAREGIILYKGSFNPISNAHLKIIDESKKLYPDFIPCFSISLNNYDKGIQNYENITNRIYILNKLGYGVIIINSPYFYDLNCILKCKYNKPIVYPMGWDTFKRILEYYNYDFVDFDYIEKFEFDKLYIDKFIVFDRYHMNNNEKNIYEKLETTGYFNFIEFNYDVSSTMIRTHLKNGNYDEIRKLVPEEVVEDVIRFENLIKEKPTQTT